MWSGPCSPRAVAHTRRSSNCGHVTGRTCGQLAVQGGSVLVRLAVQRDVREHGLAGVPRILDSRRPARFVLGAHQGTPQPFVGWVDAQADPGGMCSCTPAAGSQFQLGEGDGSLGDLGPHALEECLVKPPPVAVAKWLAAYK